MEDNCEGRAIVPETVSDSPPAHKQSDLSSHYGVCLWYFMQEITTRWPCPRLKDILLEVLKDILRS